MKKTFLFLFSALLCLSCTDMVKDELAYLDKRIDDIDPTVQVTELQADVAELQRRQGELAGEISGLQTDLNTLEIQETADIKGVQSQLDDVVEENERLAGKISSLKEYVDSNFVTEEYDEIALEKLSEFKDSVASRFGEIDEDILALQTKLEGIDKEWFTTVRKDLDTLTIRMDVAEDSIITISGRLSGIVTDVDDMKTDIATLKGDVYDEDGIVGNIDARLKIVADSVQFLSGKIESLDASVTSLITLTKGHSDSLKILFGQMVTVEGKVDSLGGVINNNIIRIDSVSTAVQGIDTRLVTVEGGLNSLSASFDSLKGCVKNIEDVDLPALESRIYSLEQRDTIVRDSLRILDSLGQDLSGRLSELESHNLDARVDSLEGDVSDLTTRVENLESMFGGLIGLVADKTELSLCIGESGSVGYTSVYDENSTPTVTVATTGGLVASVTQPDQETKKGTVTISTSYLTAAGYEDDLFVSLYLNTDKGKTAIAVITVHPVNPGSEVKAYCNGDAQTVEAAVTYSGEVWVEKPEWVESVTWPQTSGDKCAVKVKENSGSGADVRTAVIKAHPGAQSEGRPIVETVYLTQYVKDSEMKIEVCASALTENNVCLPLMGTVSGTVDWGDGTVEQIAGTEYAAGQGPAHEYRQDTTSTVTIYGYVEGLCSVKMPYTGAIRKVKQWGRLGFKSLYGAFYGCSALTELPSDTEGAFKNVAYAGYAFANCKSLTSIPDSLFTYCTKVKDFDNTFSGSGLTSVPDSLFINSHATSYTGTFCECLGLTSIPDSLFAGNARNYVNSFCRTFAKCENLSSVPACLFKGCKYVTSFEETFYFCKSITALDAALFSCCPKVTTFSGCFFNCAKLETVPVSIFDNNRVVTDFSRTFWVCDRISGESPNTAGVHLYERNANLGDFAAVAKFDKCFGFSTFSDKDTIPSDWK